MQLSPEERRRIYEEEKARIEAGAAPEKEERATGASTTKLEPHVAGLLCYLGVWVTGIIFLIIEHKDRFVRFHAMQSVLVFGALSIASAILNPIPLIGRFFGIILGVTAFVLWIILMVKAYRGQWYKLSLAGDIAEKLLAVTDRDLTGTETRGGYAQPVTARETMPPEAAADTGLKEMRREEDYLRRLRSARMTASAFAIAWSFVLLVFFDFFSYYIAYYDYQQGSWVRYPFLTADFNAWLPILNATLVFTILGHIVVVIYDKYILRETVLIILNLFGLVTVVALLSIFPFNFSAIPSPPLAEVLPIIVTLILIIITVGLGIGTLVRIIKMIANIARGTPEY